MTSAMTTAVLFPGQGAQHPPAMCLPRTVVPNSEVAARVGVDERWIELRTGVQERRRAASDEQLASLALCFAERQGMSRAGAAVRFGAIVAGFTYGGFVTRWSEA
jgi:3-oxoacyl-[acyl-carrier-protein] synthase III